MVTNLETKMTSWRFLSSILNLGLNFSLNLKLSLTLFFLALFISHQSPCETPSQKTEPIFRFHLITEPLTLNPAQQKGSGAMYLMNLLHQPLFHSGRNNTFIPGVLKKCHWSDKLKLHCEVQKNQKWSNGNKLGATDVARTFHYFLDPATKPLRPDLMSNIKQVSVKSPLSLDFQLSQPEPRFQERLTSPLLAPIYGTDFPKTESGHLLVTSGPYQIQEWTPKRVLKLRPNLYFQGHPQRPPIEIFFISEDTTALTLYEKGELDFLRRLPSAFITSHQQRKDFHLIPVERFDYVGMGPSLAHHPELRRSLTHSIDFLAWQKLLHARGRPGCFGIHLGIGDQFPCYEYEKTPPKPLLSSLDQSLELLYSNLGGDDIKRSMEWLQQSWKQNLGLSVSIRSMDNALFQKQLLEKPPTLFRFGVSLEHNSCFNAVENFMNSPQSELPFKTKEIQTLVKKLSQLDPGISEKKLCTQILQKLLTDNWIIPLGPIHLSVLIKPHWKGWKISDLNQLDLSNLHWEVQ